MMCIFAFHAGFFTMAGLSEWREGDKRAKLSWFLAASQVFVTVAILAR